MHSLPLYLSLVVATLRALLPCCSREVCADPSHPPTTPLAPQCDTTSPQPNHQVDSIKLDADPPAADVRSWLQLPEQGLEP
jgi:hypothetical protein